VEFAQPASFDERQHVAEACVLHLELAIPTVIDDMENSTDLAYSALPDRLYLIGADGTIAYRSGPGPMGFKPDELEAAIAAYLDGASLATGSAKG
jgi:type I thyroxine 5'-deiodinase